MCDNVLTFCSLLARLKHLPRTGWVNNGVKNPESVAGHMYRMAMLVFCVDARQEGVNFDRCIKMALVHDLAESIVGDITPLCGVSREEKHKRELEAMANISQLLPANVRDEVLQLFEEFELGATREAMLVRDLDKFDMLEQAMEYEQGENRPGELKTFFDFTLDVFTTDTVRRWAASAREKHSQFLTTDSALVGQANAVEAPPRRIVSLGRRLIFDLAVNSNSNESNWKWRCVCEANG
uniref:5'-deoxynucleotidase HDDC2 n=1 Tax=Trichuris muris TaxID=70415 RepID=A0A5S6Q6T4_TRIMR